MSKPDDISKAAHRANSVYENIYKQEQNRSAFINAQTPILPLRIDLTNFHHDYPVLNMQPILSLVNSVSAMNYEPITMNNAVDSLAKINRFLINYPQYDVYDLVHRISEIQNKILEYPEILSLELELSDENASLIEQLNSLDCDNHVVTQEEQSNENYSPPNSQTIKSKITTVIKIISAVDKLSHAYAFFTDDSSKENFSQLCKFIFSILAEVITQITDLF